jgi:hypothetical protein
MKKTVVSSLVLSLIPGLCLGVNDRIYKLIQEKQQKMEKLEKCQGTTKNLKIAGISTLGITAVGIGANIAEAVVLDKTKDQVKDAKVARDAELKIKEDRIQREEQDHQLFVNLCNSFGGNLLENQTACNVVKKEFADYESSVFAAKQGGGKCQVSMDTEKSKITECVYPNKHILSIGWFYDANKQQNSGQGGNGNKQGNGDNNNANGNQGGNKGGANGNQGGQQQNQETTQAHVIHRVLTLPEISNEIKDILKKPESKCSDASAKSTWLSGYTWTAKCDKIEHTFTFDGVKCAANQAFDTGTGECLSQTKAKKPLKERCDAAYGNQGAERLACCYADTTTQWNPNTKTCKCVDINLEWDGKKCVVKKDNGNQGGVAGNDGKGGNAQGKQQGGNKGGQQGGNDPAQTPSGENGNGNQNGNQGGQQGGAVTTPKDGNNPAQTPSGENGNGNQNGNQGGQQGGEADNNNGGQDNQGEKKADDETVPAEQLPGDGSVVVKNCRTAWGESFLNKTANVYNCNNDRSYVDIPLDNAKSDLKEFYNAIGCELPFKPTLMGNGIIYTDCAKNTVSGNDYISIIYSSLTCPYGYKLNEGAVQCDKVDVAPDMFANACNVISGAIKGKACQKEIYPTTEDDYAQAVEQLKSHESTLSGSDYGFDCKIEGDNTALSCTKGSYEIMEWLYDNNVKCDNGTFNPVKGKCEEAPDTDSGNDKQDYKTYNYDCDIRIKAEYGDIMEGLQKCNDGKGFQGGYNFEQIKDNQWKQTIDEEKTIRIWTLRNLYCDDNYALVKGLCKQLSANAIAKQKEIDEASKQMDIAFDAIEKEIEQNSDPKTVCEKVGGGQYTVYGSPLKSGNAYLSYCNNINEAKCNEVIKKYTGTYGHFEWKEETFFTGGYRQNEYLSYEPNPDRVETKCWFYNK